MLNRILHNEFKGTRLDFIEFYYVWNNNGEEVVSEIRYSIVPESFVLDGGKHKATYFTVLGRIKAWIISLLGGMKVPDQIDYRSYDVTAGIGNVYVTEDPLLCVMNQGDINE